MLKINQGPVTLYNELTAEQWEAGIAEARSLEIGHGYTWFPAPRAWGQIELYPNDTSAENITAVEAAIEAAA